MKRDLRIEQARQFAKKVLSGKIKNISKEDYYLFLMSKFTLLKERIMKTDDEHVAYFDCVKYRQYLPVILFISDQIKKTQKVNGIDITKVEIIPSSVASQQLKEYIWIFNKLRDSLGHGKYELDSANDSIILRNPPYMNNIVIPIQLLELFNYITGSRKSEISAKAYREYNDEIRKRVDIAISNEPDNIYFNRYKEYTNKNYNNYLNKKEYYTHKNITRYNNPDNYFQQNNNMLENINSIREYISYAVKVVKESDKLNQQAKQKYLEYIAKLTERVDKLKRKHSKEDSEYIQKLGETIHEISQLIGMCSKPIDFFSLCATYNYASQVLSDKAEAIKENKVPNHSLGCLKMSKLNSQYVKKENGTIVKATDSRVSPKIYNIKRAVLRYIKITNEAIKDYSETKNDFKRKNIIESLDRFYSDMVRLLGDRNKEIIRSLRNATEHGNVKDENGKIYLYDQSNHRDDDTINFECRCDINTFYKLIEDIDLGRSKKDLTLEELLIEISSALEDEELYESLEETVKAVNRLKLVSIFKQVSRK